MEEYEMDQVYDFWDAHQFKECEQFLIKKLNKELDNWVIYALLGETYLFLNKIKKATIPIKKALELNPDDPVSIRNWASVLIKKRNYKKALIWLQRAKELMPTEMVVIQDIGWVKYHLGEVEEGIAMLKAMLKYPEVREGAASDLGVIYFQLNDFSAAMFYWEMVLKENIEDQHALKGIKLCKKILKKDHEQVLKLLNFNK